MESIDALVNLELKKARVQKLDRNWRNTNYSDDLCRLYRITRGRGRLWHHGREFVLQPGRLYLIPSGTVFSYASDGAMVQHWVHFTATLSNGLPLFALTDPLFEIEPEDPCRTAMLFRRTVMLEETQTPSAQMERRGILYMLLAPFFGGDNDKTALSRHAAYVRFGDTLTHIESHLEQPIRVAELARRCHLNRSYFTRLFRRSFGIHPAAFIMERRVERAKQRLWKADEPLATIAEGLGFSDAFHFSRSFKRIAGISPSGFRRMNAGQRRAPGESDRAGGPSRPLETPGKPGKRSRPGELPLTQCPKRVK